MKPIQLKIFWKLCNRPTDLIEQFENDIREFDANHQYKPNSTELSPPAQSLRHPSSEELDDDEDYQECLRNAQKKNKSKKRTDVSTRRKPTKNLPTSCSSQLLDESSLFQQNTYHLQPEDARYLTQRLRY